MKINFDDSVEQERCQTYCCGGMHACRNRSFDLTKDDCQECLENANEAIVNAGCDTWD